MFSDNIINQILYTINTDNYLHDIFYNKTANRKYDITILLQCIIYILKTGISYRTFNIMLLIINKNITFPYYTTIYKFFNKLIKYNIIKITFDRLIKKYNIKHPNYKYFVDSTLIVNKLGIDKIGFNQQLLKHKTSKISLITNNGLINKNLRFYILRTSYKYIIIWR